MNTTTIFTYGTLKRNKCRHSVLSSCNFLGEARTSTPSFTMWVYNQGNFPVLMRSTELPYSHFIDGEVYEVDDETLKTLDWIEGRGFMYELENISVKFKGEHTDVNCYVGIPEFWEDERKSLTIAELDLSTGQGGSYVF